MRIASLILFAGTLLAPILAQAQTLVARGPAMTVKGEGRVTLKPELVLLPVILRTGADTLKLANETHRARVVQAADALAKLGVGASVVNEAFSINQDVSDRYASRTNRTKRKFEAVTTFLVEVSAMERLDEVVDTLTANDLFEFGHMSFKIRDSRAAVGDVRKAAVADARERALSLADAADLRLGEIIEVSVDDPVHQAEDGIEGDVPITGTYRSFRQRR
jgi:uncharacterized protein YggE